MNLKEWEEFWAYFVGDNLIVIQMGPNRFDNIGEFLEWRRQEWIEHHHKWPDSGITKAGREYIQTGKKFIPFSEENEPDFCGLDLDDDHHQYGSPCTEENCPNSHRWRWQHHNKICKYKNRDYGPP